MRREAWLVKGWHSRCLFHLFVDCHILILRMSHIVLQPCYYYPDMRDVVPLHGGKEVHFPHITATNWFKNLLAYVVGTQQEPTFVLCSFSLLLKMVDRSCSLEEPFWPQINPEWLMPCWEPQPVRPACWCREESCSGPGAPWPARRCLPEQPLTLPLKSVPAALLTSRATQPFSFPWIAHKTQSSTPQSKAFLASLLSAQKSVGKGHSLTRKNVKEDFSIHVPLCLDCLPLALPGPLSFLRLCRCLSSFIEWLRGLYMNIYLFLLIWESCLPPRPLVAIRDTRLGGECQECEC